MIMDISVKLGVFRGVTMMLGWSPEISEIM
jgi:hypothetical protein